MILRKIGNNFQFVKVVQGQVILAFGLGIVNTLN